MNEPWASILPAVSAAWLLVVLVGIFLVRRRRGVAAFLDLCGAWAGAACGVALAFGRAGFTAEWAAALLAVAVAVTASLYDRAVLLPSIEAAGRRADHEEQWRRDEHYLWRLSHGARLVTLLCVGAALWIGSILWMEWP